jgi:hypothetical protein
MFSAFAPEERLVRHNFVIERSPLDSQVLALFHKAPLQERLIAISPVIFVVLIVRRIVLPLPSQGGWEIGRQGVGHDEAHGTSVY